jgi:hypothetical protein
MVRQLTDVERIKAVGVLGKSDLLEHGLLVDVRRKRQLNNQPDQKPVVGQHTPTTHAHNTDDDAIARARATDTYA